MTEIFEKFNSLNILIIGDVMMDTYIWGKVERISPEAPVPVVKVNNKEHRLGGAANVALNIQALGGNAVICSIIGDDQEGKDLLGLIQKQGLQTAHILEMKSRKTTVKTRIIAHSQQIVRVDAETESPLSSTQTSEVFSRVVSILETTQIDAIIFEDYDKGLLTSDLIKAIVDLANQKEIITIVDPKKVNFLHYQNVTLFKPNLKELKEGLKIDIDPSSLTEIQSAVDNLKQILDPEAVMLTLSEHGVYISSDAGNHLLPAHVRSIADVSGAGDTVIATAALCLAAGLEMSRTAAVANLAGGLVCEHVGVVPISKTELLKEVQAVKI